MMALLQFMFSSFWVWLGSLLLLNALCLTGLGVMAIVASLLARLGEKA